MISDLAIVPLINLIGISSNDECKQQAAELLGLLARNPASKSAIADGGGIAKLLALLNSDKVLAVELAAGALAAIATENPDMQRQVAQGGAIPTLVALARSMSNFRASASAMAALTQLNALEENRALIREAGGESIVSG